MLTYMLRMCFMKLERWCACRAAPTIFDGD